MERRKELGPIFSEFLKFAEGSPREPGKCWLWPGDRNEQGYGQLRVRDQRYGAHNISFRYYKGIVPRGFVVMHECDNPPCWNPEHLFLGTHAENMQDMVRKGRQYRGKKKSKPSG